MYTIKMAARLSGVNELTIRAWEKRYLAFNPQRTETNRRLYSTGDIEKMTLLRQLISQGHRIGDIADLPLEKLESINSSSLTLVSVPSVHNTTLAMIDECLTAVKNYDSLALFKVLNNALIEMPVLEMIETRIIPLIEKIGNLWHDGELRVAQEHFATSQIKSFLAQLSAAYVIPESAPKLVIAAPEGQLHELEAIIAAMIAKSEGWRAVYLGPGLPVEEIAAAAIQLQASCVHLSIVYPQDDTSLLLRLPRLRLLLGNDAFIIASGRSADGYVSALKKIDAHITGSPREYREVLSSMRAKLNRAQLEAFSAVVQE